MSNTPSGSSQPSPHHPPNVAVIGAGPAGLMAAEVLNLGGARVTLYDRMPSAGRKFLLAGRGGLNLTYSEPVENLLARYGTAAATLRPPIEAFSPTDLRAWCAALGQETFVGSSGRVFPRSFKASPLLRAWLRRLDAAGVLFRPRHRWTGWGNDGALTFDTPEGTVGAAPDATVLALGGASWPQLGSDGAWTALLARDGMAVSPLRPSNCGVTVAWSALFRDRFEGQPLKGVSLAHGGRTVRGEVTVTRSGLEGGGIYALSAMLRDAIAADGHAVLQVGLRPDLDRSEVERRLLARAAKASLANHLRKALKLSPVAIGLLQEVAHAAGEPLGALPPVRFAALIGAVPVRLTGTAPLAEAISTAGGIFEGECDGRAMLRRRPGTFAAGEMLDWEAPTGGYLLQACFSTGAAAGAGALAWLAEGGCATASAARS